MKSWKILILLIFIVSVSFFIWDCSTHYTCIKSHQEQYQDLECKAYVYSNGMFFCLIWENQTKTKEVCDEYRSR